MRRSAVAAVAAAAVLVLGGCGDSADPDGESDAEPTAGAPESSTVVPPTSSVSAQAETGKPTPQAEVPSEAVEDASKAATDFAEAIGDVLAHPDRSQSAEIAVAGAARDALLAQAEEYRLSGWRIQGRPRVVAVEVYERSADRMVVGACLDDSSVRVLDEDGNVVSRGQRRPTLNLLTLSAEDGAWAITESSFPADPDC